MDNKIKGLILTYEGLSQIIESQLIEHSQYFNKIGKNNEVWVLCGNDEIYNQSIKQLAILENKYGVKIFLFKTFSHNIPFSQLLNAIILLRSLHKRRLNIDWVHARTEYTAVVAILLKIFNGFKIVYDVRGDTYSEIIDNSMRAKFLKKVLLNIKAYLFEFYNSIALRFSDNILFVSSELSNKYSGKIKEKKVSIIPCLANPNLFYFDHNLRREKKENLGYFEEDVIIGYLGSATPYQCVEETMECILSAVLANEKIKVLIITREDDIFKKYIPSELLFKFKIISSLHQEVNGYLNAMDYAFLIRKKNSLNYVSSPIKYAEYSMTGIKVITTNAIDQVVESNFILNNSIFINMDKMQMIKQLVMSPAPISERINISKKAKLIYSRESYLSNFNELY